MYQSYWQLDGRPFEHASDERYYYAAESQRGALLKLRYVLENRAIHAARDGRRGQGARRVPPDGVPAVVSR